MTLVIVLRAGHPLAVIEESAPSSYLAEQINSGRWVPDYLSEKKTVKEAEAGSSSSYFARQVGEYVVVSDAASETGLPPASMRLLPREYQVLICLANGATFQEIAATFNIKERTVRTYVARMKNRLEALTVAHLVGRAIWMGVIKKDTDLYPGCTAALWRDS